MRTTLPAVWLLTLAAAMLFSASEVDSYVPIVALPCCLHSGSRKVPRIRACYEQKPRDDCHFHAFLIVTKKGKQWCIDPNAAWLKDKIEKGQLACPPDLSLSSQA